MKIRIYAVLPETEEDQLTAVSGEVRVDKTPFGYYDISPAVNAVCRLYPDWKELSIERITSPD